jgi:hypothetical protein
MKKILSITTIAVALVLASCNWDELGELNQNPNQSTTPKTRALLTNSIQAMLGGTAVLAPTILSTQSALYAQHVANKQYTSADNYQTINFATDAYYNGPMMDLQKIVELNTNAETKTAALADGSNANQIAIARILMSYYFLHMTDRWGDIPYSEALRGSEGILKPKFDTQESIYDGCIQTLKDAVAMMDNGAPVLGDVLLSGNMDMWIKFANTTRLIAALRLSKANPTKAATEFASAFNAGVLALDNSENVKFDYLNVQTYENPYYNSFVTLGRRDWTIADPLMNRMQLDTYVSPHLGFYVDGHPYKTQTGKLDVVADPRLPVYAAPIENTTNTYIGMPYGLTEAQAGSVPTAQISYLGTAFRQQNSPAYIYTASQVAFVLAEGRLRDWINTGTVQGYYEQGIQASLNQYGVDAGYAAYITNSEVAFDANRALEQIITQKWIATFPNGYEAWSEWRRTGFPVLASGQNALTPNSQIPRRQAYGTTEANLNSENYQEALTRQGLEQDDLTGRVWWDKL